MLEYLLWNFKVEKFESPCLSKIILYRFKDEK